MESIKVCDLDRADEELYKLSAICELLSMATFAGLSENVPDGVFFIMRDSLSQLRKIFGLVRP